MYKEFRNIFIHGYGRVRLAVLTAVITVAVSLLEGFNIGLLVPLLESLQSSEEGGGHWVSQALDSLFSTIGLPFTLGSILVALGALVLFQAVLKYWRMILVSRITTGFVAWMRTRAMATLLNTDISYFHQEKLGTLANTLTTQPTEAGATLFAFTELFATIGIITAYFVAAFLISPVLAAVAFGIMMIITLSMQFHIRRAKTFGGLLVERNNDLHTSAVESLSGIRVIKSFVLEHLRGEDFRRKAQGVGDTTYRLDRNRSQIVVLQEMALFALVGAIVYVGVSVLNLDLAVTVALLFILYRLAPRISNMNNLRQGLASSMASLRNVEATISQSSATAIPNGTKPFVKLHGAIELENVSFSYNSGAEVLQDANFAIEHHKITALVGTSGAGKSTLIDLILRYYDPLQGRMLVDGVDLRELDLVSWRKSIGIVSQDIFLFNDTVANNILLGQPDATMEQVVDAVKRAYAHDFILQMPQGYDTPIGDRGWNLSGGQRQRLALARAILKEPQILILDEATSSLDSESEQLIQNHIRAIRGTCTILVVAHRVSTIQDADRIAVLQDGKIVEEGDWDSLLARTGVFANYHRLQLGNPRE